MTLEVGKYFTGLKFYLCEHVSYTVTDVMMKLDFPKRGRGYRTYEEAERALTLRNEYKNPIAIASVLCPSLRYEKASMQQGYLPRGHVFFGRTTGQPRKK